MTGSKILVLTMASAIGAFVGGLISLEIAARFYTISPYWGAVIGGFVGYILVDPYQVRDGAVFAYRHAVSWRPNRKYWKLFGIAAIGMSAMVSTAYCIILPIIFLVGDVHLKDFVFNSILAFIVTVTVCFVAASDWKNEQGAKHVQIIFGAFAKYGNPVSVVIWSAYVTVVLLKMAINYVAAAPAALRRAAKETYDFLKWAAWTIKEVSYTFFRYIHSKRRLVCFLAAGMGSAVGFYLGSAIAGAVAGGAAAATYYQVVGRLLKKVAK